MKKILLPILAILSILALFLWRSTARELHTKEIFVTDVFVELEAEGNEKKTEAAFRKAIDEIRRIDARLGYRDSLITELNRRHVVKDREVYELIRVSKEVNNESSGAFSCTLKPILDAWGFTGLHPYRIPTPAEFSAWRSRPGDDAIRLHPDGLTVETPAGTEVDIGGTLEGYAADRACEAMRSAGIRTGLVNAGGEVAGFGGRTWRVGIKNPRGEGLLTVVPLKDRAIATSGDYERFFVENGKRYSHTLDPGTGWPARKVMSASVMAKSCTLANAWAVALFVAGPEKLGPVLDRQGMDWIVVDREGKVYASAALREYVRSGK